MRAIFALFWTIGSILAGTLLTSPVHAQTITIYGEARDSAIAILEDVVQRGEYIVLDRDTVLESDADIGPDVIVVAARVALEGTIRGGVLTLDGELFVRPGAYIGGPVAAVGTRGGVYPSALAEMPPVIRPHPRVFASVGETPDGYSVAITGPPEPGVLRIPGIYGLGVPTYDRVNGLSLFWGATAAFGGGDTARVALSGTLGYRVLRKRLDGQLVATVHPTVGTRIQLRAARGTRTMDTWIRGDLANSLSSIIKGSDVRDYFDSEEVALTFEVMPPASLIEGEGFIVPGLTARVSRDRSVEAGDPWSLLGDDWRPNPPIDPGTLASFIGGARFGWRGISSRLDGSLAVEWAPEGIGDFEFAQLSTAARWTMEALWGHSIGLDGFLLLPLTSDEAPMQRWSHVGGAGTLPTFPLAAMRGDHVVYLNSVYLAPLRRTRIPILGHPAIRLEHMAGAAWRTDDSRPPFEQNVAAGVQLSIFRVMVVADPADGLDSAEIYFGAQLSSGVSVPVF